MATKRWAMPHGKKIILTGIHSVSMPDKKQDATALEFDGGEGFVPIREIYPDFVHVMVRREVP